MAGTSDDANKYGFESDYNEYEDLDSQASIAPSVQSKTDKPVKFVEKKAQRQVH